MKFRNSVIALLATALVAAPSLSALAQPGAVRIDVKKKSGEKAEIEGRKVLGGQTEHETKEKFYEVSVRSMSPAVPRVNLEYLVIKKGQGGQERPGRYEKVLLSTPMGQLVTLETETVELVETTWKNEKRIVAPHVGSAKREEELVGIAVVATNDKGEVIAEHYEPSARRSTLKEWMDKARVIKADQEKKQEQKIENGRDPGPRPDGRKPFRKPFRK